MRIRIPARAWEQVICLVDVAKLAVKKGERTEKETTAWLAKQWIEIEPGTEQSPDEQ